MAQAIASKNIGQIFDMVGFYYNVAQIFDFNLWRMQYITCVLLEALAVLRFQRLD